LSWGKHGLISRDTRNGCGNCVLEDDMALEDAEPGGGYGTEDGWTSNM
jgi:hypothetical protein